eukprot:scaffold1811_cov411-Prasinococcus_capsulatus_cf.AAC.24
MSAGGFCASAGLLAVLACTVPTSQGSDSSFTPGDPSLAVGSFSCWLSSNDGEGVSLLVLCVLVQRL